MRVNVYAEEMTDRIEIITKEIDGNKFTALRFYLELPVTVGGPPEQRGNHRSQEGPEVFPPMNGKAAQVTGPFIHRPGDDDSAAVTFWGKQDLRIVLRKALAMLDTHYAERSHSDRQIVSVRLGPKSALVDVKLPPLLDRAIERERNKRMRDVTSERSRLRDMSNTEYLAEYGVDICPRETASDTALHEDIFEHSNDSRHRKVTLDLYGKPGRLKIECYGSQGWESYGDRKYVDDETCDKAREERK